MSRPVRKYTSEEIPAGQHRPRQDARCSTTEGCSLATWTVHYLGCIPANRGGSRWAAGSVLSLVESCFAGMAVFPCALGELCRKVLEGMPMGSVLS
eukprot:373781-Amphidinium_carterae.1